MSYDCPTLPRAFHHDRAHSCTKSPRARPARGRLPIGKAEHIHGHQRQRLEVGLFAVGASLAKAGHSQQVRVGRLVRSSLEAGSVSFSVSLSAKGKTSLRRHRRLALTVKLTRTPVHRAAVTVTRGVVVHA